ncbi:conserved exported hypothetical protein [uncultured Paludibacter sp.]|uniref:HYDIN/VesB/CFA65-like Ig-like domain-containing protein n=1 Tax=uncultured Paludibacter sp. TaxID=497635 RepID=A0A653AJA4_9BACT|nr:conserved exported hypothetical protein [uncultured Paludibacter sp.]
MKRKLGILLAVFTMVILTAAAQKPVISFPVKEHDFGQVNEQDGKITYVFEFTNTGSTPLIVQRVQASCGCTTPDWTKEPIEPGKKGTITATYNPQGRPGVFTKSITVYSNASNETEVLYIKGNVIPKPQETANNLPLQMGGGALRYNTKIIQMNNIAKNNTQTRSLGIKNSSNNDLKVDVANLPAYVNAVVTPSTLKPGQEGKIDFTFNSAKTSMWGPVNDDVFLVLNGKKTMADEYKVSLLANVVEDFGKMTIDDKRNSPIFEIKSPNIYLGEITQGHKVRGKINIKNSGKNSLEIRRIVNNNNEILVRPATMSIKSGKTSELKVDINSKDLAKGEYKRTFTMQTNDPQNSFIVFNLSWKVK